MVGKVNGAVEEVPVVGKDGRWWAGRSVSGRSWLRRAGAICDVSQRRARQTKQMGREKAAIRCRPQKSAKIFSCFSPMTGKRRR